MSIRDGKSRPARGEHAGLAKLTDEQAEVVRTVFCMLKEKYKLGEAIGMLAILLSVFRRSVWRIIKGIGYINQAKDDYENKQTV